MLLARLRLPLTLSVCFSSSLPSFTLFSFSASSLPPPLPLSLYFLNLWNVSKVSHAAADRRLAWSHQAFSLPWSTISSKISKTKSFLPSLSLFSVGHFLL